MDIRAGTLTAIYLFDVAEQIDVPAMRRLLGGGATSRLPSLDDIYRFAVEQVSISRGQFLELAVVLILVLELILFFLGIMK